MADQLYLDLIEKMLGTEDVKAAIPEDLRNKLKSLITAEKMPSKESVATILDETPQ